MINTFHVINTYLLVRGRFLSKTLYKFWKEVPSDKIEKWRQGESFAIEDLGSHVKKADAKNLLEYLKTYKLWEETARNYYLYLIKSGASIIDFWDRGYPVQLKYMNDPPLLLFAVGNIELLSNVEGLVSIVGTRRPTVLGVQQTRRLSWEASLLNMTTVSGFAIGIDKEVWNSSLKYKGNSIAVLPSLGNPRSFANIQNNLVVSEYPYPDQQNKKWQFLERNRLIAGLSIRTIVVEAPLRSGALSTAAYASSYGRDVFFLLGDMSETNYYGGIFQSVRSHGSRFIVTLEQVFDEQNEYSLLIYMLLDTIKNFKLDIAIEKYKILMQSYSVVSDLRALLWRICDKDLKIFQNLVIELKRIGFIKEHKNCLVLNLLYYPGT
jgi:DNA processing protein